MTYLYTCKNCKDTIELNISIRDELPKEIDCPTCKEGKAVYDWTATKPSIIVPYNFKAVNSTENRPKYGKKADNEPRYY